MKNIFILLMLLSTPLYSAVDKILLQDVQIYLNEAKNIKGKFAQTSSNGAKDSGDFYLSRPSLMRLDYKSPQQMVSDGKNIGYYDKKLDQLTYISLSSIPAGILLKKNINLTDGKEIKVIETKEIGGLSEITATLAKDPGIGNIKLYFDKSPTLSLVGWETKDATGLTTRVNLTNIENAQKFDKDFFTIKKKSDKKNKNNFY